MLCFCAETDVDSNKDVFTVCTGSWPFLLLASPERGMGVHKVLVRWQLTPTDQRNIPCLTALCSAIILLQEILQGCCFLFRDCLGLAGGKQLGFLPIIFFSLFFLFLINLFLYLYIFLSQPMNFIPFALLVLFPISLWRSEQGLAVYWGQITIAIKKICHQIPSDFFLACSSLWPTWLLLALHWWPRGWIRACFTWLGCFWVNN